MAVSGSAAIAGLVIEGIATLAPSLIKLANLAKKLADGEQFNEQDLADAEALRRVNFKAAREALTPKT